MKIKKEVWKICTINTNYEVSNFGEVRCKSSYHKSKNGKILSIKTDKRYNYRYTDLWSLGRVKRYYIHKLVLLSFVGECPEKHEGCHKDGNKHNNKLSNLYWGTRKQNVADAKEHGTHCNGFALAWKRGSFTKKKLHQRSINTWKTRNASKLKRTSVM